MNKPTKSFVILCKRALDSTRELLHASAVRLAKDPKDMELRADHEKVARDFVEAETRYKEVKEAFHA